MNDRQNEIRKSAAFKGAIDIHAAIFGHSGTDRFERSELVRSVRDLTMDFVGILEKDEREKR